jgi:peptidoglycan-N-acetylglucosamine deacetylase
MTGVTGPPETQSLATPRRAFAGGRRLFVAWWLAGLGAFAGMLLHGLPASPGLALAILLALCLSIAVGVIWQRSGLLARPIIGVDGAGDRLALTFDDGPDPEVTPRVLEALAAAGQHATFFALGERVARHPELARRIVEEGHELANHSFAHAWHLGLWPAARVAGELSRCSRALQDAAGVRPRFFRPPAAVLTPRVAAGARRAGLLLCGHTLRSGDGSPYVPPERILARLQRALRPGAILVLHDGPVKGRPPASLALLPELLEELSRRGLRSETLSALLPGD